MIAGKNLGSLWDDLGKAMENEDEIEIGEVDRGTEKPICTKADIHSYPTFKVFYDGEEVARYQGCKIVMFLACQRGGLKDGSCCHGWVAAAARVRPIL